MIEALNKLILQLIKKAGETAKKENLTLDKVNSISQMSDVIIRLICLSSGLERTSENSANNESLSFQESSERIKNILLDDLKSTL